MNNIWSKLRFVVLGLCKWNYKYHLSKYLSIDYVLNKTYLLDIIDIQFVQCRIPWIEMKIKLCLGNGYDIYRCDNLMEPVVVDNNPKCDFLPGLVSERKTF